MITGLIYSLSNNKWPGSKDFIKELLPKLKAIVINNNIKKDAIIRLILRPWYLFVGRTNLISESLYEKWGIRCYLDDIAIKPQWVINATSYESGKLWQFIPKKRVGDYINKYILETNIPLKDALAASAAYPGFIGAYILDTKKYNWVEYSTSDVLDKKTIPTFKKLSIWDGGVYDNLGTEPLTSFKNNDEGIEYRDAFNFLIISNASKSIEKEKSSLLPWRRVKRLLDIAMSQVNSLRTRIIMNHFCSHENSGVYLKIGNNTKYLLTDAKYDSEKTNYYVSKALMEKDVIRAKNYKTDLNAPTVKDFDLLFRHGWEVCNYTLISRCPELFENIEYSSLKL